jgi:hypothetical protein
LHKALRPAARAARARLLPVALRVVVAAVEAAAVAARVVVVVVAAVEFLRG